MSVLGSEGLGANIVLSSSLGPEEKILLLTINKQIDTNAHIYKIITIIKCS